MQARFLWRQMATSDADHLAFRSIDRWDDSSDDGFDIPSPYTRRYYNGRKKWEGGNRRSIEGHRAAQIPDDDIHKSSQLIW